MKTNIILLLTLVAGAIASHRPSIRAEHAPRLFPEGASEPYFTNIRSITTSGTNAEAYWSPDGKHLVFQAIRGSLAQTHPCDQIYTMDVYGNNIQLVSTGRGRDTCSYYTPDQESIIYSSTQGDSKWCNPTPDPVYGYVWPVYKDMDIWKVNLRTKNLTRLTNTIGYDAETTLSPDGKRAVFTSDRDGDLELYSMNIDGSEVRRLTYTPGYDGGAFYSFDSQMLTWRASRPNGADLTDYLNLLSLGIVRPSDMQIYVAAADGSNMRQLTNTKAGVANFAPFFLPGDSGVIFASNMHDPNGGDFQLYMVKLDGTNLTQVTFNGSFNSFPMFSPDGKTIAWESNRNAQGYDINVFLAEWVTPNW